LFPFSKSQFGKNKKLIPFAIDEAEGLYSKHLYVSLSLAQMWRTREDCMTAESGLDHLPGVEEHFRSSTYNPEVQIGSFRDLYNRTDKMARKMILVNHYPILLYSI